MTLILALLLLFFAVAVFWRYESVQRRFGPMGAAAALFGSVIPAAMLAWVEFQSFQHLFVLAGVVSNGSAVLCNGGYMPAKGLRRRGVRHRPLTRRSRLRLLTDVLWGFSVGDILLSVGAIYSLLSWGARVLL